MSTLRVAYINIEFDRHLDRVVPFLKREAPDVVLLNELMESDVPMFERELGMKSFFTPQLVWKGEKSFGPQGHGVFSALSFTASVLNYGGEKGAPIDLSRMSSSEMVPFQKYDLLSVVVTKEGKDFSLGLVHYPWTPDGEANDFQRDVLPKLFSAVDRVGELVLFGDFNAPRGKEIFSNIAARMKDNIPASYITSLDGNLHRVGKDAFVERGMNTYMVDGCFTTPGYIASNVRLEFGISDHAAVIADISRRAV